MMNYESAIAIAKKKIDRLMERFPAKEGLFISPTTMDGKYKKYDNLPLYDWTRSFFTGMLAYMYYHYKEQKYLDYLMDLKQDYKDYVYGHLDEIEHDTGFLYSLYAVALYRVSGDKEAWELSLKAADEVSKRHHYESGVIQGFCRVREKHPMAIIDDCMNLAIIMWAYRNTNHMYYERIYKRHIQAVLRDFLREDYSFRHAVAYDYATGSALGERNYCGFACGSIWTRGQAWGITGLINALITSGDEDMYLPPISGVMNKISFEFPKNGIPLWDLRLAYDSPKIIDTSAAIIMACAFEKLKQYLNGNVEKIIGGGKKCFELEDTMYNTLINEYLSDDEAESIINGSQSGLENAGSLWGDYFFVEYLMRKVHGKETPDFWI